MTPHLLRRFLRLAALLLGLGGLAGTWWTWWMVARHIPLAFQWWVEYYVEPFIILAAFMYVGVVAWEEAKRLWRRG